MQPQLQETFTLFWKEFGLQLTGEDELFVAPSHLEVGDIQDALHKSIPAFSGLSGRVVFFFIDREPSANWGHNCLYILYLLQEKRFVQAKHILPPAEEISLVELSL